jgi:hypothetical protein
VTEALACSARRASRTPAQDLKVKITGITARMVAYSARSRTPFRVDAGQHSAVMADTVPR